MSSISILTMCPEMFRDFLVSPVIARAQKPRRLRSDSAITGGSAHNSSDASSNSHITSGTVQTSTVASSGSVPVSPDRAPVTIRVVDIRPFAGGSFRHIDDSTFGGGAGMVMRAEPFLKAIQSVITDICSDASTPTSTDTIPYLTGDTDSHTTGDTDTHNTSDTDPHNTADTDPHNTADTDPHNTGVIGVSAGRHPNIHVIAMAPSGIPYTQPKAHELADRLQDNTHLILLCGHYEGFDQRILDRCDEILSIGDYVLTGGEIPAMAVVDSVVRLLPGVLRRESTGDESFEGNLLEYPQYTQPADPGDAWTSLGLLPNPKGPEADIVPAVLLSGDHRKISTWRREKAVELTRAVRPDLLPPENL